MNDDTIKGQILRAQTVVVDLESEFRVPAFAVVLRFLLGSPQPPSPPSAQNTHAKKPAPATASLAGRILALKEEGFFVAQHPVNEVRDQLKRLGFHHTQAAVATKIMALVQRRELRREKVREGAKEVWKYSNF